MRVFRSIGVTASREGLTDPQKNWIEDFLEGNLAYVLHHGMCKGGDIELAVLFRKYNTYIIAHPGHIRHMRAASPANDLILPWSHTLVRNRIIVNHSELILGFPKVPYATDSGTWHTIKFAKKQKTPLFVIGPDGSVIL